ncbi:hypothetical protein [Chitinophaga sp. Cy-1792]|uniref:hypothetical protein n=1 Tax=Chitinophaga sp. Cy-1792 TaxID=2608339 RepID=UPI00141E48CE|nr:hypothetical protein [Chitinophaga sp. Cy-1792]NIG57586.1 hypothetical protein [Chitinophaga sp. Cy-1792]
MTTIEQIIAKQRKKFAATTHRLRERNFERNLPFLILSEHLPSSQGYYEFADGHIEIQEVYTVGPDIATRFIRTLSDQEAEAVREYYKQKNGLQ